LFVVIFFTLLQVTNDGYHNREDVALTEYLPPQEGAEVRHVIPLSSFPAHVEAMHANENCGLGDEYRVSEGGACGWVWCQCVSWDGVGMGWEGVWFVRERLYCLH